MRRFALAILAVLAAVLLQVVLVDRISFPGGAGPDVVLVVVVALAVVNGPVPGMMIGFAAGLALDVAPPASHLLGLSALVFCLAGYGAGLMRGVAERSSWLPLAAVAGGIAAGEGLYAVAGLTFGDPDITVATIRQVLPPAVAYELLLSPFALYAVVRLGRYEGWVAGPRGAGLLGGGAVGGPGLAGTGGALRDFGAGRAPRLGLGATRGGDGWVGGRPQISALTSVGAWARRARSPQLRLRGGVAGSAAKGVPPRPPRPPRPVRLRFGAARGDGMISRSSRGNGLNAFRDPGAGSGLAGQRMRGAAFRRGSTALGAGPGSGAGKSGGQAPRAGGARIRAAAFRGGPSALGRSGWTSRSGQVKLRLRRRGDGVIGGGAIGRFLSGKGGSGAFGGAGSGPRILGWVVSGAWLRRRGPSRTRFGGSPGGSALKGSALGGSGLRNGALGGGALGSGSGGAPSAPPFLARRAPGAPGPLRTGRGAGATPRFGRRRGLLRWLPGERAARDPLSRAGRRGGGPRLGRRGGLGGPGLPGGLARRMGVRRRAGIAPRLSRWWTGSKRTGGLP